MKNSTAQNDRAKELYLAAARDGDRWRRAIEDARALLMQDKPKQALKRLNDALEGK